MRDNIAMSNVEFTVNSNFEPLTKMRASMKKEIGVKVGVLGSGDNRKDDELVGNAELALWAEYGVLSRNIKPRSILRLPLMEKRADLEAVFAKPGVSKKIIDGDIMGVMTDLGLEAEVIIDQGFKTSGFGQWKANEPSTIARKGSSKPEIDTSQLRRSITSKVVVGSAI